MRSRLTTTLPAELRQMQRPPYLTRRRVDDSRVVVHLEGEHDVDSAARLARELEDVFGSGADAIIDLSDAEFDLIGARDFIPSFPSLGEAVDPRGG
jgi:hypothetical protein